MEDNYAELAKEWLLEGKDADQMQVYDHTQEEFLKIVEIEDDEPLVTFLGQIKQMLMEDVFANSDLDTLALLLDVQNFAQVHIYKGKAQEAVNLCKDNLELLKALFPKIVENCYLDCDDAKEPGRYVIEEFFKLIPQDSITQRYKSPPNSQPTPLDEAIEGLVHGRLKKTFETAKNEIAKLEANPQIDEMGNVMNAETNDWYLLTATAAFFLGKGEDCEEAIKSVMTTDTKTKVSCLIRKALKLNYLDYDQEYALCMLEYATAEANEDRSLEISIETVEMRILASSHDSNDMKQRVLGQNSILRYDRNEARSLVLRSNGLNIYQEACGIRETPAAVNEPSLNDMQRFTSETNDDIAAGELSFEELRIYASSLGFGQNGLMVSALKQPIIDAARRENWDKERLFLNIACNEILSNSASTAGDCYDMISNLAENAMDPDVKGAAVLMMAQNAGSIEHDRLDILNVYAKACHIAKYSPILRHKISNYLIYTMLLPLDPQLLD